MKREGYREGESPYIGEEDVDVGYEAYGYGEDVGDEGELGDEPMAFEGEEREPSTSGGSGRGSE